MSGRGVLRRLWIELQDSLRGSQTRLSYTSTREMELLCDCLLLLLRYRDTYDTSDICGTANSGGVYEASQLGGPERVLSS